MKRILLASALIFTFSSPASADKALLEQAINGNHRSAQHKSRDQYRHPLQTLEFFSIQPHMSVVEIWPGGKAWYTEILAPYLKQQGTLYAAHFSDQSGIPYFSKSLQKFKSKIKAQPSIYKQIKLTVLHPPQQLAIAPKASVDRVLTFRNVHNWMKNGQANTVFSAMYQALKPYGILGVVEHRAPAYTKHDPKALSGYVTEASVIALAEKAGFKLLAKSEINANPKDTTNHPKGVWTLPPSLKLKDQQRDKYLAIGESDRMTLQFIKIQ